MITQDRLKELLRYDPDDGNFYWRKHTSNSVANKDVAGTKHPSGYITIGLDRKYYRAHRLVFLYTSGKFPKTDVDHINGIKSDNRLINLREVSRSINNENLKRARSDNQLGFLGVSKLNNKFRAYIGISNKNVYLGTFDTPEEASKVYLEAKQKLHKGYVHEAQGNR